LKTVFQLFCAPAMNNRIVLTSVPAGDYLVTIYLTGLINNTVIDSRQLFTRIRTVLKAERSTIESRNEIINITSQNYNAFAKEMAVITEDDNEMKIPIELNVIGIPESDESNYRLCVKVINLQYDELLPWNCVPTTNVTFVGLLFPQKQELVSYLVLQDLRSPDSYLIESLISFRITTLSLEQNMPRMFALTTPIRCAIGDDLTERGTNAILNLQSEGLLSAMSALELCIYVLENGRMDVSHTIVCSHISDEPLRLHFNIDDKVGYGDHELYCVYKSIKTGKIFADCEIRMPLLVRTLDFEPFIPSYDEWRELFTWHNNRKLINHRLKIRSVK